jgi:hypothetical protein
MYCGRASTNCFLTFPVLSMPLRSLVAAQHATLDTQFNVSTKKQFTLV